MKIADPDQKFDKEGVVEHCTLMMFARNFEDLPIIQRVGEIIRVHRAHVQTYKNVKQFTCNIFFNSSWALFSPLTAKDRLKKDDDQVSTSVSAPLNEAKANLVKGPTDPREFQPFAYLGKTFSFEASEKKTITNMREWIAKSFAKNNVLSERYISKLKDIPEVGAKKENGKYYDFDLQVKVVQLFKIDDYSSEVRVIDASNELWHCQVLNLKYRFLREGQYVRIRAATLEHHQNCLDGRSFGLKNYSNILSLPYPSVLAQSMKIDVENVTKNFERTQLLLGEGVKILHPTIISKVTHKQFLPLENLDKILNEEAVTDKPHRVRIGMVHTKPALSLDKADSVLSLLRVYNIKTSTYREYNPKQPALKKDEQLQIAFEGLVQDYSLQLSNQVAKVLIKGDVALFTNIKCEELIKKPASVKLLHLALTNMLKFNVYIEAVVAYNKEGVLEIRETELKQY